MAKGKATPAQKRKPAKTGKVAPKTKTRAKGTKGEAKAAPAVFVEAQSAPANSGENQTEPKKDTRFKPGQSGNPAGKPKGARHKLGQDFIRVLAEDFATHGKSVIELLRKENPAAYAKTIAGILPKVIEVEDEDGESREVTGVLLVTKTKIADLIAKGGGQ